MVITFVKTFDMKVGIIGGGAAGFFAAITCATQYPNATVIIFEKSNKLLSKVKVSGGGRCNVTNATFNNSSLIKNYPRGEKFLKKCFNQFNTKDTVTWFESRGVKLKTEIDNRMFPISDSSQTIVDCLLNESRKLGVTIKKGINITKIKKEDTGFLLQEHENSYVVDKIIIAPGGSPKLSGLDWIAELGHIIEPPVPSLFTFNMPDESVTNLMGVAVENAIVKVQGSKLQSEGALLVTHWGMSGPAILKLSAWGARILNDKNYTFDISINWSTKTNEELVREQLNEFRNEKKKIINSKPFTLPNRLWEFLLNKINLNNDKRWIDLSKKELNRLVNILYNDTYHVLGKTTFKEEFVTCGGVSLNEIDVKTMESKVCADMYFCGEVMDIDGITGGFNFQAAWTTGYIAGKNVCR